jgi:hypothetical protein
MYIYIYIILILLGNTDFINSADTTGYLRENVRPLTHIMYKHDFYIY